MSSSTSIGAQLSSACTGFLRRWWSICLALSLAGTTGAQISLGARAGTVVMQIGVGAGDISENQAVEACHRFLRKCRMAIPSGKPTLRRRQIRDMPASSIVVTYEPFTFLVVDGVEGEVTIFSRQIPPSGKPPVATAVGPERLRDEVVARAFLRNLLTRLGMSSEYKIVEFKRHLLASLIASKPDGPAVIDALFQPMPHGYRLRNSFGRYDVTINAVDGMLIAYMKHPKWSYTIESHEPKLTFEQAKGKAASVVREYGVGKPRLHGSTSRPATRKSELMLVRPNDELGSGIKYEPKKQPARLRLAWVLVYSGDDEVWIDAGDGRLLGGIRHGYGNYR